METHWCRKLKGGIGREIENMALNAEKLQREKKELLRKLDSLEREIKIQEHDLLESINQEWSREEINTARFI
ncbi:hypothetical protein K6T82_23835 [Flavobacterium sp. 17A]|uniref:Uncharacterized protein n=1 Tax=Flavobacterium potami TaxID=2872310 RepID=A0A9X1KSV5_9FLAO|nr:hypothetical protein [Flavobacterium potami]MBZ4037809.1 hypothetical protein [Flavobacterium potami]